MHVLYFYVLGPIFVSLEDIHTRSHSLLYTHTQSSSSISVRFHEMPLHSAGMLTNLLEGLGVTVTNDGLDQLMLV